MAIAATRAQQRTAVLCLLTSRFALCVADLPSSSVYRITALLSRILVWSTNFSSKKSLIFSRQKFIWVGAGLGLVRVRLRSGDFLAEKLVNHTKRHDKIFPDFYELGRARGPERDNIAISRPIFGAWT